MENTWTVLVSGPLTKRASLLTHLGRSKLADVNQQPELNPSHGLPHDPKLGWVTYLCDDHEGCREIVLKQGYQQRMLWATPACKTCAASGHDQTGRPCSDCGGAGKRNIPSPILHPKPSVYDELAAMKKRLAVLEGREG